MNATSTFALPRSPGSIFRPTWRGNRLPGAQATMPDWNNDRARCFVRPVLPAPAQQLLPEGLSPRGEERRSAVYAACARLAAMRRVSNHEARPWPPILRDAPAALLRMRRMFHQNFPPVPDLALPLHSTGAKP
jgi:hypothetical protein